MRRVVSSIYLVDLMWEGLQTGGDRDKKSGIVNIFQGLCTSVPSLK